MQSSITVRYIFQLSLVVSFSPPFFPMTSKQEQVIAEQYGVFDRTCCCEGIIHFKPVVSVALDDFVLVFQNITCVVCRVSRYSFTPP